MMAMFSVFALVVCSLLCAIPAESDGDSTYGSIQTINVAPDFSWTYPIQYPSDLTVKTSIVMQGTNTGSDSTTIATGGTWAELLTNTSLKVVVPSNTAAGTHYDIILMAETAEVVDDVLVALNSEDPLYQVAYQYLRINVTSGLTFAEADADECINALNDILTSCDSITINLSASSSMASNIIWSVKNNSLPNWLTLSGNQITLASGITSIPAGEVEFTMTATANGESDDLPITFKVWNVVQNGGASENLSQYASNNSFSSASVAQLTSYGEGSATLPVTWAVTKVNDVAYNDGNSNIGETPLSLNASTGVISGTLTVKTHIVIEITGTATDGPEDNSAIRTITIDYEPLATIDSIADVKLVEGTGSSDYTFTYNASELTEVSKWQVSDDELVTSIGNGTFTVSKENATNGYQTVTIEGESALGQEFSQTVRILVEEPLSLSGNTTLKLAPSKTNTVQITATGGYNVQFSTSETTDFDVRYGVQQNEVDSTGKLYVKSNAPSTSTYGDGTVGSFTTTVTATTDAGQTATHDVTVTTQSVLSFSSSPENGLIAYAIVGGSS